MITELHTVTLYVRDQDRAKRFYVEELGFEPREDVEMPGGTMGRWIEVAPAGTQTAFLLANAAGWAGEEAVGSSADVTLRCADVRALHAELVGKGVPVSEPMTQRFGTFIDVTDPDGHRVRIVDLTGRTLPEGGSSARQDDLVSVRYMVDDVDAALAFYTTNFGFTVRTHASPAFADLVRGHLRLLLSGPTSSAGRSMPDGRRPAAGGWNRIHLIVDDIGAEVGRLRAAGVASRNDVLKGPGGSQILFEDPSGNPIELFQPARSERPAVRR